MELLNLGSKQSHMNKEFKKVMTSLSKIPNINHGGCGLSALALFDTAKIEGMKPKIIYLYTWSQDSCYRKNQKFKEGKSKTADSCSHIVIKLDGKYYDSDGKIKKREIDSYTTEDRVTRKHLIASINNVGVWNELFDRKKWASDIEKFFKPGTNFLV